MLKPRSPNSVAAINGSHGEWTNSDDVKNSGRKQMKQKPQKPGPRKPRTSRVPRPLSGYNECGVKYLLAVREPFHPAARGACVPRFPSRPSQKVTGFLRTTVVTGTSAVGYVLVSPCLGNDHSFGWTTGGTFTGSDASITQTATNATTTTGVTSFNMTNLPYTSAQLIPTATQRASASGRIVSVGVRIYPFTAASDLGGISYALVDPSHANNQSASTAVLGTRSETIVKQISRDTQEFVISAMDQSELEFGPQDLQIAGFQGQLRQLYPYSSNEFLTSTSYLNGGAPFIFMVYAPVQSYFHVEIIMHAEYIGPLAEGRCSPNMSDDKACQEVMSAANNAYSKQEGSQSSWRVAFDAALREVRAQAPGMIGQAVGRAAVGLGRLAINRRGTLALEYR